MRRFVIIATVAAAVAAYILAWQWDWLPRKVLATGTVRTEGGQILETRQYLRSTRDPAYKSPAPGPVTETAVWEVRLQNGRWIDCGPDCKAAAEAAGN